MTATTTYSAHHEWDDFSRANQYTTVSKPSSPRSTSPPFTETHMYTCASVELPAKCGEMTVSGMIYMIDSPCVVDGVIYMFDSPCVVGCN